MILQNHSTLNFEVRQLPGCNKEQPKHASYCSENSSERRDVKPPSGVAKFLLCAVNISLVFSSPNSNALVPQKKPLSEVEIFPELLDHSIIPGGPMLRPVVWDEHWIDLEERPLASWRRVFCSPSTDILDHTYATVPSALSHASSEELFADLFSSTPGVCSPDTESAAFSCESSSLFPSQDASSEAALEPPSSIHIRSMTGLIDGALRNLICPKPMRTAPGLRAETSTLEARLTDIAPSTFIPGYTEAVATRAPFVPTVARFLVSFLQRVRSVPITTRKDRLIRHLSQTQSTENLETLEQNQDEEAKLKDVVKTHLWVTMTNSLRDPEPARRLGRLQASARLDTGNSTGESRGIWKASEQDTLLEADEFLYLPIRHGVGEDGEMLGCDEDDQADDYDDNLFEEFEEHLRTRVDRSNDSDLRPPFRKNEECRERKPASEDSPSRLPSPMLEFQGEPPQFDPDGQLVSTSVAETSDPSSGTNPAHGPLTTDIGSDGAWSNLLDEKFSSELEDTSYSKDVLQPSPSIEDNNEPDFEQWEFDVEQGYDEMLC